MGQAHADATRRPDRWMMVAALVVGAWAATMWLARRHQPITDDWMGWRQADTQAMARNYLLDGGPAWAPRIDWRGDGTGEVETEAPVYPLLVAAALRVVGLATWPGQLLSLLAVALAVLLLARDLARRHGPLPGAAALLALLAHQGAIVMSTSIQPDGLAVLAFTLGWLGFVRWAEAPSARRWFGWVAATALAGLLKPTTLELGLAQGLFVLLAQRGRLRAPGLWLGWAVVVVLVAGWMLHARGLYLTSGNTFGVLSGGDSKLPTAAALAAPSTWLALARFAVPWGLGWLGAVAALVLLWRRQLVRPSPGSAINADVLALAGGALVLLVLALRYTAGPYGTHYHLPHLVLGATLVARAAAALGAPSVEGPAPAAAAPSAPWWRRRPVVLGLAAVVLAAASAGSAARFLRAQPAQPETALAARLGALARPGTLVVVRARAPRRDPDWGTRNNFEDPRVFYGSRTRGWVLANDDVGVAGVERLAAAHRRGARFYAHVAGLPIDVELATYLGANASLVDAGPGGPIYQLR
jgi:hypothetical protein